MDTLSKIHFDTVWAEIQGRFFLPVEAQRLIDAIADRVILDPQIRAEAAKTWEHPKWSEYICAHCSGQFNSNRTEEELIDEMTENTPPLPGEEIVHLCDDCYQLLMKNLKSTEWKPGQRLPERQ